MAQHITRFPKGHTKVAYMTRNMSRQLLDHAGRVAALRAVHGRAGTTTESVILDCLLMALPKLERAAVIGKTRLSKG